MAGGAQKPTGNPRTFEAPVYGSDEAIAEMRPTYGLGGVPEPSREELATMQKGPIPPPRKGWQAQQGTG